MTDREKTGLSFVARARVKPVLALFAAGLLSLLVVACSEEEQETETGSNTELSTEPVIHGEGPGSPETFELANGMSVVVIPDRRAPVVTHMVWYRVGAADEPVGMSGVAHFLEHLMFKGTKTIAPGELSRIVARNGGQDNAFTSQDYTAYYQRVAIDRLPLVMEMEADRMCNLILTDAEVLPERDVVLEERRMRIENNPRSILSEKMDQALFPVHPYGTPVIGWAEEIAALSTQNAIAYYDRFYTPNNAILIVAGDISAAELRPLAEKYYGVIEPRMETPIRVRETNQGAGEAVRVTYADARVQQPVLQRVYRVPNYLANERKDGPALEVMATLLGGSAISRLYRNMVVEKQIATSAGAYYSGAAMDEGTFGLYAIPTQGQSLEDLEAALDAELAAFIEAGVTEKEVAHAVNLLIASAIYARDDQEQMTRIYGVTLTTGGTVADVLEWPDRLRAVTPADVVEAARRHLLLDHSVTGLLLPGREF
ncbi:MAG: insulinase family protein [Alphaproteobacteria bacterium]|nr:insulinase family protein [Alphaproteobacteria bacterium]MBO6627876.1 insulinase family protein [Alphaproteobacteria bacterium]